MKERVLPKIGIIIGDAYGREDFRTDVKDPHKAIEEANEHLQRKYSPDIEIGLITQHKRRRHR
jgi:hypothetical protein